MNNMNNQNISPNIESLQSDINIAEKKVSVSEKPASEVRLDNAPSTIPQDTNTNDDQVVDNVNVQTAIAAQDQNTSQGDNKEFFDDTVELQGDHEFIGAVKRIIREDADEPFEEESGSEQLQRDYLKSRFGVDVITDKETR